MAHSSHSQRAPRNRALAIRRPSQSNAPEPAEDALKAPLSPGRRTKPRANEVAVCRNILQHGTCRKEGQGCPYLHPATTTVQPTALQVQAAVFVPKSTGSPAIQAASINAPVFTPQRPLSPSAFAPDSRPFTPEIAGPLMRDDFMQQVNDSMSHLSHEPAPFVPSNMLPFNGPYQPEPDFHPDGRANGMPGHHDFFQRQQVYYHLYQGPLPHLSSMNLHQAALASFFISPSLREDLQKRAECLNPSNEGTDIPGYFSIVPLDSPSVPAPTKDAASNVPQAGLGIFGIRNWVYKAFSEKDGKPYVLRRLEGFRLTSRNEGAMIAFVEKWRKLRHPSLVSVVEAFTTKAFGDSSLVFVYDYHPLSSTLYSVHLSPAQHHRHHALPPIPERTLWSYVVQLCNVLKLVHSNGLAARTLESTKILVTGKDRLRVNCCSILDVIRYEQPLTPDALRNLQQEDLFDLGKVVLSLACQSAGAIHNLQKSIEHLARVYSPDLQQLCLYLFSKPHPRKTIDEILNTLVGSWRLLEELNASLGQSDILESEMLREVENARLVRLLCKFGFINERPEFDHDPRWADSGDRYLVKLFRDHVFHQVSPEDGKPVLDLSHVLSELNKLDAGSDDKLMLMSRDGQNCLVVSYRDIKACVEAAFRDLAR